MTKCDKCKDPEYLETIFEHCQLDLETQEWERRVAYFFKANPEIYGLSYTAADILRREKNLKTRNTAISIIHDEIEKRRNLDAKNYSIIRRRVTADQVHEILKEQRIILEGTTIQREKLAKKKEGEAKEKEQLHICPSCGALIYISLSKRGKIVSLRVTKDMDDGISFLSKYLDVTRSLLVSGLLEFKMKFPESAL